MPIVGIIVVIALLMLIFGGLPQAGYHQYGYGPSGIGVVLLIVLLFLIL